MNENTQELLLLSCSSSEPFSTKLINPFSGTSVWSFRNVHNHTIGCVETLGSNSEHMLISTLEKPLLYLTSLNSKFNNVSTRSILSGVINSLVTHKSGTFVFAAIENKIYSWTTSTGELLSIAEDGFQHIKILKISACGSFLIAGFVDGYIKVYLTSNLIIERFHQIDAIKAVFTFTYHSLAVSDIYITSNSANPRILSVSLDHTIVYTSLCVKKPLLKILTDLPISSCSMDTAETKIICGFKNGKICVLDIFLQNQERTELSVNVENLNKNDIYNNEIQYFDYHTNEISKLSVNLDGTILASGDLSGCYCIWDLSNGQCLRTSSVKYAISTLKFVEVLSKSIENIKVTDQNLKKNNLKLAQIKFQKTISTQNKTLQTQNEFSSNQEELEKILMNKILKYKNMLSDFNQPSTLKTINSKNLNCKRPRTTLKNGALHFYELNDCNDDLMNSNLNNFLTNEKDFIEITENYKFNSLKDNDVINEVVIEERKKSIKRIEKLEKEIKHLIMVNHELYEFAANMVADTIMNNNK